MDSATPMQENGWQLCLVITRKSKPCRNVSLIWNDNEFHAFLVLRQWRIFASLITRMARWPRKIPSKINLDVYEIDCYFFFFFTKQMLFWNSTSILAPLHGYLGDHFEAVVRMVVGVCCDFPHVITKERTIDRTDLVYVTTPNASVGLSNDHVL